MWAALRLGSEAYGLAIRDELELRGRRSISRGATYVTLDRLVRKGYLASHLADPSEKRAGRPRRYFRVTAEGRNALQTARDALVGLWSGFEREVEEG